MRPPGPEPFYGAILAGSCVLSITGRTPVGLTKGDFMLVPPADGVAVTSVAAPPGGRVSEPVEIRRGVFRLGEEGEPDTCMLVGHCTFGSNDAALLMSLLPDLVVVRGERRLTTLVELLSDKARAGRGGRDAVLARLLAGRLSAALRATTGLTSAPGLLRGLADERLAAALRRMHGEPTRSWTVDELAREAALSRSTFFDRFRREVGVAPKEYLLGWRMALAKDLLRGDGISVGEVAQRVGYSSSSTFSVAFGRQVGTSPKMYARGHERAVVASPAHGDAEKA